MTRTRTLHITLAVLLAAVVAGGAIAASAFTTTGAKAKTPALKLAKTSLGTILVDSKGRTLYAFGHDLKNKSRCSGQCASNWPPAKAPAKPTVAKGINKSKLKVIKRSDGSPQLSYNGHPLYRFIADSGPGSTNGENITAFGGTWDVLSKSGTVVTHAPSGSSSGPAPYGY
jgi:predicted lipoprotein with Yx(FWY)xxD motif